MSRNEATLPKILHDPALDTEQTRIVLAALNFQRGVVHHLTKQNPHSPGSTDYQLGTLDSIALPHTLDPTAGAGGGVVAHSITRATAKAGGVTGALTVDAYGATPATGEIAVAPNGDIVVLNADAITDLDVSFISEDGEIVEETGLVPASGVVTPLDPRASRGLKVLLEAEILTGTTVGKSIILVPASSNPATTKAALDIAKKTIRFNSSTDAPLTVRVRYLVPRGD